MTHTFAAGTVPSEWAVELITNPAAWGDENADEVAVLEEIDDLFGLDPAAEPKSIEDMTKDELLDEVGRLRDEGVEFDVNTSSRKDEILDALRAYRDA